jgi:transposase
VEGFAQLEAMREKLSVAPAECWVGLETAHNLLIDFLWARGYTQVYVVPPSAVQSARKRYRQTGAHHDQSDAYVIGDMVRTDQARLQPWHPDSQLTQQLRAKVGLLLYLTREMTRASNRLRAVLLRYYPSALRLFSQPLPPIGWHFLQAFPTPQAAAQLSREDFEQFLRARHYRQPPATLLASYARLHEVYPTASDAAVAAYQEEAQVLASQLLTLHALKTAQLKRLTELFHQHPEAALFESLPGAGEFLAPALLAKFGDERARFATAANVQALAGTCPVTAASGKRRVVHFRQACDHDFRHIVQQWALASLRRSTWAAGYWAKLRPHCASTNHTARCLANRWLAIAWKVWHARTPYDEAYHLQQRAKRQRPVQK